MLPEWMNANALTWLVPLICLTLGWLFSEIKNRGKAELSTAATHRRLNEMRDAILQLTEMIGELRDIAIARGDIAPQRSSPSRPPISRNPMQLK
jgi:uncharacterized protein YjiS (DUF1127 family)